MTSSISYTFQAISHCNMCKEPVSTALLLGRRLNCSHGFSPWKKTGIATTVLRCSRCDLVYTNPQPIPVDIQDHYGIPPEDYWTPAYFEPDPTYFASELAVTKELLPFRPGMRALDVGAGIGKCMRALEQAGFVPEGIEPGAAFHEKAISEMHISPDRLQLAGMDSADFAPGSFDFITFGAVLEHLPDPALSLERALAWTKSGGLIHAEVPSSNWLIAKLVGTYYKLVGNTYSSHLSPMHAPFHLFEFGEESFHQFARAHGVRIEKIVRMVGSCDHVPKPLHPLFTWYMDAKQRGMQLSVWIRKP